MAGPDLHAQLADLAASVFGCASDRFLPETRAGDIQGWDSLNHVKLLVAIENALGLRFSDENLEDPENWAQFVAMIEAKTKQRQVIS